MNTQFLQRSAIALALAGIASLGVDHFVLRPAGAAPLPASTPAAVVAPPAATSAGAVLPDFAGIVARRGSAVVNIRVEGHSHGGEAAGNPFGQLDPSDPFFQFFRRFGPQFQAPGQQPVRALGSGFIVAADGLIMTNAHVVADATEITVRLTDKREFKAKLVGIDKPTDIALIRIEAKDLPTIPIGDPARTRVGDWVLAIGSPFGFDSSVTAGIVSAKSRALPEENYVPFIQTDVAVNPGNSGGPLLNLDGEVIGINSQIYSRSGGYQGLSFAIPIDVAQQVKTQLLASGKVTRGRLGVAIQGLDQALAKSFGLNAVKGALVSQVEPDSPAAKAGLAAGDVIIEFNGEPIPDSAALPPRVAAVKPGQDARLTVWRDRHEKTLTVTVGELESTQVAAGSDAGADDARLGVAVRPLSRSELAAAHLDNGLMVMESNDAAARAGIQAGDVILAVNGQPTRTVESLRQTLKGAGEHAAVLVQRGDARIFIPVTLG